MLDEYIKNRIASGEVKLDMKGHFGLPVGILTLAEILELGYTEHIVDRFLSSMELIRLAFDTDAETVAIRKKLKNFEEIPWYTISRKSSLNDCGECSQDVGFEFNGKLIRTTCDCLNPGGLGPYSVEIPVPSGKLIFTNDLRILVRTERDYDVNQRLEIKLCCEDYARGGMIHFYVGNTCPGVFRNSDTSLFVGNEGSAAHGEIWDEEKGEYIAPTPKQVIAAEFKNCEKLDSISTDLWWYSAIDYDLAMKICKEMGLKLTDDENDFFVVNVKPGIYRAASLYHNIGEDFVNSQVYSTIDWVRECTESDMPVIKIDESLTATTLKESHLWKNWRRAVDGKYKNLYPTFTGWLQNKFCVAGTGDAWDNGVITHEGRDKAWFKTGLCESQSIIDFNPPSIKETNFEKSIWTFSQLDFLARPKVDKDVTDFFAPDLDSVVTHSIIYPLSESSFGVLNGMPYEVNEYYLAAQLTFFATLIKYPMFFPEDHSVSKQIKIVEKILDILYVNVIERKLEERMKEIFAEFEAAGSDLTDVHENYNAYV